MISPSEGPLCWKHREDASCTKAGKLLVSCAHSPLSYKEPFPNFIFDHFFSFLFFMRRPFPTRVDKDAATTCPFAFQFPHFVAIHFPLKKSPFSLFHGASGKQSSVHVYVCRLCPETPRMLENCISWCAPCKLTFLSLLSDNGNFSSHGV